MKTNDLSKTQREMLLEAFRASDGVAWLAEPTLKALEKRGLVDRLHETCSGVRLTPEGLSIAREIETITYTTAPADYDWFGTTTVATVGRASNGKAIRKVVGPTARVEAQRDRYASGLHMVADETEWAKLVAHKLVTLDGPLEVPNVPVVTKQQIEQLLDEAAVAGDMAMVSICMVALERYDHDQACAHGVDPRFRHPVDARDECVRVIVSARAQS